MELINAQKFLSLTVQKSWIGINQFCFAWWWPQCWCLFLSDIFLNHSFTYSNILNDNSEVMCAKVKLLIWNGDLLNIHTYKESAVCSGRWTGSMRHCKTLRWTKAGNHDIDIDYDDYFRYRGYNAIDHAALSLKTLRCWFIHNQFLVRKYCAVYFAKYSSP